MKRELKNFGVSNANRVLDLVGLRLTDRWDNSTYKDYIPFRRTVDGAKKARVPVGEYIDMVHNVPGKTQETIDQLAKLDVYAGTLERICEIGPGSGRYLEKTLKMCTPAHYEVYETAEEWKQWLVRKYNVIAYPADGTSLGHTPSNSIDLVQAHKVFPGTPFLTTLSYYSEMARVVRENGRIVFDILTEGCMDDGTLEAWMTSMRGWPGSLMPKQYTIDFFTRRGIAFVGSFCVTLKPGLTEYLVFKR